MFGVRHPGENMPVGTNIMKTRLKLVFSEILEILV